MRPGEGKAHSEGHTVPVNVRVCAANSTLGLKTNAKDDNSHTHTRTDGMHTADVNDGEVAGKSPCVKETQTERDFEWHITSDSSA